MSLTSIATHHARRSSILIAVKPSDPPAVNRRMLLGLSHGSATRACLPTQKRMVRTAIANFSCPYCLGQALASVYVSTRKDSDPR